MHPYFGWGGKDSSRPYDTETDKAHLSKGNGASVRKAVQ